VVKEKWRGSKKKRECRRGAVRLRRNLIGKATRLSRRRKRRRRRSRRWRGRSRRWRSKRGKRGESKLKPKSKTSSWWLLWQPKEANYRINKFNIYKVQ